jgi:hypothetical protein
LIGDYKIQLFEDYNIQLFVYIFTRLPRLKTIANHVYMRYRKILIYKWYIIYITYRYIDIWDENVTNWKCKNVQSMGQDISIAKISDFDLEIIKQCK